MIAPPWSADFELPLEALVRARARLTIVCNPNSPSGTLTPRRTLARLARLLDGRLLAIDEAYVDFAEENALDLVRRFPNVLVLRSLSKSYSLAGMRLGLCFAHPRIIEQLGKVKDSYNLSRLAIAAGAAALDDNAWMLRNVERVKRTRAAATGRLLKMGFAVPPSSANFVLARMPGPRPRSGGRRTAQARCAGALLSCMARRDQDFDRHAGRDGRAVQGARAARRRFDGLAAQRTRAELTAGARARANHAMGRLRQMFSAVPLRARRL